MEEAEQDFWDDAIQRLEKAAGRRSDTVRICPHCDRHSRSVETAYRHLNTTHRREQAREAAEDPPDSPDSLVDGHRSVVGTEDRFIEFVEMLDRRRQWDPPTPKQEFKCTVLINRVSDRFGEYNDLVSEIVVDAETTGLDEELKTLG